MRILMLNYEYPPLGGGGGKQSMLLARAYAKNHDVYFLTTGYKNFGIAKKNGYILNRIKTSRTNTMYCSNKEMMEYVVKAWNVIPKIVAEFKPDIVHAFFTIPTGLLIYHPKLKDLKFIVSVRGSDVPGHNPDRFSLLYKIFTPIVKNIWRRSHVVCNSEDLRREVLSVCPGLKVKVIPNAVDTEKFRPLKKSKQKKEIRILYVGRLIPLKQVDLVIKALPGIIKKIDKKIIFRIIGSGPDNEKLKRLVKDLKLGHNVKFIGEVDYDNIHKEYQNVDIYIQLSKVEGMSNTILEAMSCGLPIITTNVGDAEKIIRGNGILIGKNSDNINFQLVIAVKKLGGKASKKYGKASREIVLNMNKINRINDYLILGSN